MPEFYTYDTNIYLPDIMVESAACGMQGILQLTKAVIFWGQDAIKGSRKV